VLFSEMVELSQNCIGRPVDINRVGFETHLRAIRREGLNLVEENDKRFVRTLSNRSRKEVRYSFLAPAQGRARQCMRFNL